MAFYQKETERDVWGIMLAVLKIHIISHVRADKVLVLSPHPNDDALGCGGLLKELSESGAKIKVIYFSDGSRGTRSGKANKSLIAEREEEAREAGKILGVGEEKFLRLPDTKVIANLSLAAQIRREIEFDQPDLLLSPSLEDPHPDHHAVAGALYLALKNYDGHFNIWLYEVWGTGRLNRLMLIDDFVDDKREALKCHKSQMKVKRYDEAILALNQYRALSAGVGQYAEAFYSTGPRNYRKLFIFYTRHHESNF